jgi:hypothetical protein
MRQGGKGLCPLALSCLERKAGNKEVEMSESHILFDIPDGREPADRAFLEQLGHRVMVCPGPDSGEICPILNGEGCPLAEEASGIVFELDLEKPQHQAILARYKGTLASDLPIRVVVRSGQAASYPELLHGLKVLNHVPAAGDLDALAAEVEARTAT